VSGSGEWSAGAADGGGTDIVLPWWLALILLAIPVVEPFVSSRLSYRSAMKAVEATNKATEATRDTAAETNALTAQASDRDLIKYAMELARSEDPQAKRQGLALLQGLSQMPGLTQDDAILVQAVTRPLIESTLSAARELEGDARDEVEFVYDDDDAFVYPVDEAKEGDDEGPREQGSR
jgi:hypothetical protein